MCRQANTEGNPVPRITSRDYADLALGGKLDDLLTQWKEAESQTFDQIVNLLAARGVHTSRETVRRWMAPPQKAAS